MADEGNDKLSIGARQLRELREAEDARKAVARAQAASAQQGPPAAATWPAPPTSPGTPSAPVDGSTAGGWAAPASDPAAPPPGWWLASDGNWYPPQAYGAYGAPTTPKSKAPVIIAGIGLGVLGLVVISIIAITVLGTTRHPVTAGTQDGFSAEFPIHPKRSIQNASQLGSQLQVTVYESVTNKEDVGVAFTDLPTTPIPAFIQRGLDASVDGVAAKTGTTVQSRSNTTFLGTGAEDAVLSGSGRAARVRVFVVGSRLYEISGFTKDPGAVHPDYDRLLATFTLK
jgi:hypothetical protein